MITKDPWAETETNLKVKSKKIPLGQNWNHREHSESIGPKRKADIIIQSTMQRTQEEIHSPQPNCQYSLTSAVTIIVAR